jgi:hypothetical protein
METNSLAENIGIKIAFGRVSTYYDAQEGVRDHVRVWVCVFFFHVCTCECVFDCVCVCVCVCLCVWEGVWEGVNQREEQCGRVRTGTNGQIHGRLNILHVHTH